MTALGGKLPEKKGHDDLTVRVKDFVAWYDKYVKKPPAKPITDGG